MPKRKIPTTAAIDWSKKDIEIAKSFNVSRERIRQIRKAAGLPPSKGGRKLSELVMLQLKEHSDELPFHSLASLKEALSIKHSKTQIQKAIKALGYTLYRGQGIPTHLLDWNLPIRTLAVIWKVAPQSLFHHKRLRSTTEHSLLGEEAQKEIAAKFFAIHHSIKKHEPRNGYIDWSQINWNLTDQELAHQLQKPVQYVKTRRYSFNPIIPRPKT